MAMNPYELIFCRHNGRLAIVPTGEKGMSRRLAMTGASCDLSRLEIVVTVKDYSTIEMIEQSKRRGGRPRKQRAEASQ